MTRSFVFTNHKGGVGKSTSATNVAYGICGVLASAKEQGRASNSRVLLIDTDSQGHASLVTTGRNDYGEHNSLYTVIKTGDPIEASTAMAECIVPSDWHPDLNVLPCLAPAGASRARIAKRPWCALPPRQTLTPSSRSLCGGCD